MDELKPCPFCGGEKISIIGPDEGYWTLCLDCLGEGGIGETVEEAVSLWNLRDGERHAD